MSAPLAAVALLLACYAGFVFVRLGFHQRLPLLFKRWRSINQVLEEAERRHGERVLIELGAPLSWSLPDAAAGATSRWSAGSALRCVRHLAGVFDSLVLEQNERIAIYKTNEFDLYLFGSAALRSGAIAVPINGNMDAAIALGYLGQTGASVLLTDAAHLEALRGAGAWPACLRHVVVVDGSARAAPGGTPARPRVSALRELLAGGTPQTPQQEALRKPGLDDPHFIVHTSGTTGIPKGVLLTGTGLLHSLRAVAVFNLISRRDLVYLALPMNHQIVQLYLQAIFLLGVHTIVDCAFDGARVLDELAARRASVFFGFPIAYIGLMEAGLERAVLPHMRIWGTTADASHEVFQRAAVRQGGFFRDIGIPVDGSLFVDGLGSSEVGIAALMRIVTPWTRRFGRRIGRRAPLGPRIRIADAHGRAVPSGQAGRLLIKGSCMLAGYWNAHDQLYGASRDGWWFTGDIVRRERGGELVHLDREVDVIHTRRGLVYTLLVEERLHLHPAVLDVCVFGVPHGGGGHAPAAVVALRGSHRAYPQQRLADELSAALAPEQQLAFMRVVDWSEFPIGVTGKTLKRTLRERHGAPAAQPQHSAAPQTAAEAL